MGATKRDFMEIRSQIYYLENLSISELKKLLPAYNEYVDQYIRNLIINKEYQ